jgi:hypothetical protein
MSIPAPAINAEKMDRRCTPRKPEAVLSLSEFMKSLILALTLAVATVLAQRPPPVKSTPETAPKPELFRDPLRKVKNAKGELVTANLRPLFAWFQNKRGERPMKTWNRFILTTVQNTPEGVVVSNFLDNKIFFLRNYPYKVPTNSVIHVFAVEDGFHSYKDVSGGPETVHAYDYGTPVTSGSAPTAKPTNAAAQPFAK